MLFPVIFVFYMDFFEPLLMSCRFLFSMSEYIIVKQNLLMSWFAGEQSEAL